MAEIKNPSVFEVEFQLKMLPTSGLNPSTMSSIQG